MPWNLVIEDRACIGDEVVVYNLAPITIKSHSTVAQEVYLCAGTHDFSDPRAPLMVAPITVGSNAFIGVRALILPGVEVGAYSIIGAGSVVARDVPEASVVVGNPGIVIRKRESVGWAQQ